jgi:flagellar motor switch protein FliG
MPSELSDAVMSQLSETEVSRLSRVVASLPELDPGTVKQVMAEYMGRVQTLSSVKQGGFDVARRLLRERLGVQRADEELERLLQADDARPFAFLHGIEPERITELLADEHPQVLAVVVAHLPSELGAKILGALDEGQRGEVALRIGTMGKVPHEAVIAIATSLSGQFMDRDLSPEAGRTGKGSNMLASILNRAERQVERAVLTSMDEKDPELAEEIRRQLFTFDDVLGLDDRTMQKVLRVVQPKTLATALKGADKQTMAPFVRNMSENAAADLVEAIESLGPVRMSEIEGAQVDIARKVRDLEVAGQVTILRKGDEVVV